MNMVYYWKKQMVYNAMSMKNINWAFVTPMANEEKEFEAFTDAVKEVFDELQSGTIYLVVDLISKDRTLDLCRQKSALDKRFVTIWAPQNNNVVDAYLRGYKEAVRNAHEYIIEMDAGMSHDPAAVKLFLFYLVEQGYPCVYGSRFSSGGSMAKTSLKRFFFSRWGSKAANLLLGTNLKDMTSGYQGFHADIVRLFMNYPFKSVAHFYQTELKYLLRKKRAIEIPINYKAPSPNLRFESIVNAFFCLLYYFSKRIMFNPVSL